MIEAYHMLGLNSADFFRMRSGRITKEQIIEKGQALYEEVLHSGKLIAASQYQGQTHSRQFHLDRLVGDDRYVYFSVGRRYWNEPAETNFGFGFDAERLLREHGAILRTQDLLSEYEEILDDIVQRLAPPSRSEFSTEEVERLMASLGEPGDDEYTSPSDAYYALLEAVEHQHLDVPLAREATDAFLRRARELQSQAQLVGEAAITTIKQEGETGKFELLVAGSIDLSLCIGNIYKGVQQ